MFVKYSMLNEICRICSSKSLWQKACSADVLVPDGHMAGCQVELHGAEQGMSLLVLGDTHGCAQIDLLVSKTYLLLLHHENTTEALA